MDVMEKITHARSLSDQNEESNYSNSKFANFQELVNSRKDSNQLFLTYYDSDGIRSKFTYHEFCRMVFGIVNEFECMKISKGDRIATIAHNHWQTIVQYVAAWYAGVVVVPVNVGEDDARISFILKKAEIRFAFVHEDYEERICNLMDEQNIKMALTVYGDLFDYAKTVDKPTKIPASPQPDDNAFIVFTSGTTGDPKGVVLTQRNLLDDAGAIAEWHGIEHSTTMMCVLPIHHVNGTVVTHITPFFTGGNVVLNQKFSPSKFWNRINDERVEVVSMVPTLLSYLTSTYKENPPKISDTFRHVICGAGPLTVEVGKNFEELFNRRVVHGYGLSETTCYSCFLPTDLTDEQHQKWMQEHGYPSIGMAIPPNEMAIQDDDGNSLEEGERGEIVIRGHNVMKEYFNNPEANEEAFANGWFRSGDEGFFLTDDQNRAFYFITGRLKELIIRGGVNLAPLEIDEVINKAPGVKAGIAVGFENDWYGEEVGAYIQLNGIKKSKEEVKQGILDYCNEHLPFSKTPKVVVFGDKIPVTSTGKYQRIKVAPLFEEWKKKQFRES